MVYRHQEDYMARIHHQELLAPIATDVVIGNRLSLVGTMNEGDVGFPNLVAFYSGFMLNLRDAVFCGHFYEARGEITHNSYEFGGKSRVQSLLFHHPLYGRMSTGIILGWDEVYDFGINKEYREVITVLHGTMIISGMTCTARQQCFVEMGVPIKIECHNTAAYSCVYDRRD